MFYFVLTSNLRAKGFMPLRDVCFRFSKSRHYNNSGYAGKWTKNPHISSNFISRLWAQTRNANRQGIQQRAVILKTSHKIGVVTATTLLSISVKLKESIAHCEMKRYNSQKKELKVQLLEKEPEFNWKVFWIFFNPQLSAFLAAVLGLRSITQTAGCFVSLYLISPKLTTVMVVVVPCLVATGALIGSFLRKLSRRAQEQVARATGVADEALGNVRAVRAFAMESRETELYTVEVDKSSRMNESLGIGIAVFQGLSNVALNCIVLGTIYIGGSFIANNDLSAGDLMSFYVASQTVQRSLANISILFGQVVRGMSAGARVFEHMVLEPTIPLKGGISIPLNLLTGHIKFSNISFNYPTRPGHVVLKDFDLVLPPYKTVAIVGESGGGKSTVAALLERFYDPDNGIITLDGHDIKSIDPSWLRGNAIGFISQEPVLFGTSVMENIRFGKPDATDKEVYEAAKMANAHHFITNFPDGYNTVVGERGVTLSGGQKQRIAIARALIKNPRILILDEATSALDAESERAVQDALDRATSGRTVLIIAHRLSTIQNADIICVLSNGNIKEMGSHETLLKKEGLYSELIKRQRTNEQK
ncbi:mitochondrial potassium channel ATP-binding subunit isoform X2 [Erpetoichthys calabaricus]|uniref:mitochondrial potassium channel ATP-binding subunit isoform X2 n=1 Tax=Erpetoichthys calabaricus TaxID=27687 RepID=UPI0022341BCD|nr:mitochondrial potassium channel ATP-binding subunit isoform X2 [Erpetoichthys calabaricus]